jgi:hypothetical protein
MMNEFWLCLNLLRHLNSSDFFIFDTIMNTKINFEKPTA